MSYLVEIRVYSEPADPNPTLVLPNVPWYAGLTVLQAMIIGEAMYSSNFTFRVLYRSIYGAQIDQIDGLADGDRADHFWMLSVNGHASIVGVSEAIIQETPSHQSALVEWRYTDFGKAPGSRPNSKTAPL